jgi:hypothetical protein
MANDNVIKKFALDELVFDPKNPRLPNELSGVKDEKQIIEHMLRDESLLELMKSIGQSGYYYSEPLLVVPSKNKFIVVEGNRRLAALKLLSNPDLATIRQKSVHEISNEKIYNPTEIPCIQHGARDDVLDYLGYRHITGVKSWGALEKARYLEQLYTRHTRKEDADKTFKVLAKIIGSRPDYVGKLLASLNLYDYANDKAYFKINITEKDIDFSLLSTAIGYNNIYGFIGLKSSTDIDKKHINNENFEFLFRRLYDPRLKISESRELKDLNSVIGDGKNIALEMYKGGISLAEALYYTHALIDTFDNFLSEAKKLLTSARNCQDKLPNLGSEIDDFIDKVRELEKISRSIRTSLEEEKDLK